MLERAYPTIVTGLIPKPLADITSVLINASNVAVSMTVEELKATRHVDSIMIDSGATTHLECEEWPFVSRRPITQNIKIVVASGEVCVPDFIGSIQFSVPALDLNGQPRVTTLTRHNVLCCKALGTPLFSPRKDWEVAKTRVAFEDVCKLTLHEGYQIPFQED